jgi:hypothetical protein
MKTLVTIFGVFFVSLFFFAFILLTSIVLGAYYGWAMSILWSWFMVPIGLPKLSVVTFMGIFTIKSLLFTKEKALKPKDYTKDDYIGILIAPLAALLMGYLIKTFLM